MSPIRMLIDQQLIALLKNDDRDAFAEIYKRYWTIMYMHALKMIRDQDDARDTVQEVFTALWIKRQSISPDANLAGFLFISTKNKVLDLIARNRVKSDYLDSLAAFAGDHNNQTLGRIEEKEIMAALDREIALLPPKMKQIFEMRIYRHCTYKEIADELNLSDKTVKKQISNAIKVMRPRLQHLSVIVLILSGL
ncbi:RNA polymerase sigma-70 factor [Mucilaginibacter gossypii]|uniref:RNA polymerase sigma factor n=1 Tax=Mucilaginibacter gossypii TaxID=551996 RepID=UPI000DCE6338|nr:MULTISPECIES: RNA polymerase sigma-70 factor [Mucilaginibacter]QTE38618.1 RNA polymerase sigma-70 factor [Mucilaginibacter gossypii]RAV55308.1 RNA polymerase subunit sigma-70 [Mucilaginibacter rubeus]